MIKSILKHLLIFAGLVLAISSLDGCKTSSGVNNANTNANVNANIAGTNSNTNSNAYSSVAGIDYPPLASALTDADFELVDGTKFKVGDNKGKVLLLNIWGIWCGPCRAEMPELVRLQDQYREQGLEIVGINIGADQEGTVESVDKIKKFADNMKLNYTLARAIDPASVKAYYGVTKGDAVPQNILVDRQGRLRGVFIGFGGGVSQKLEDTMSKVIAEQ
jgi:thiol-disulfide isomerase/thioredoxin